MKLVKDRNFNARIMSVIYSRTQQQRFVFLCVALINQSDLLSSARRSYRCRCRKIIVGQSFDSRSQVPSCTPELGFVP